MIMTGEKTGNMEQMVTKVAEYYEQETVTRQNALALASGMVLFLIVAIYVGIVVVTNYQNYGNTIQQASSDKGN